MSQKRVNDSVRQFKQDDLVWLRSPGMDAKLEVSWLGPYMVTRCISDVTYELDLGRRKKQVVHANNLNNME